MNEDNDNYETEQQRQYAEIIEEASVNMTSELPRLVAEFQKDAIAVSFKNDIPAALSCFVILGQICKDFIQIPNGRSTEDSRVHFCQIQTSGSGKSTLWNFVEPVSEKLFTMINESGLHVNNKYINSEGEEVSGEEGEYLSKKKFDIMSATEYTDAALVGGFEEKLVERPLLDNEGRPIKQDENGTEIRHGQEGYDNAHVKTRKELGMVRQAGLLEGSGLAHWDEFEYSGVFKQSQNKEQAIVYLNTLMNTLAGSSWVIKKKLKQGDMMKCYCERSILAMTYPPEKLAKVIANKGVLQRMILFIWDVPEHTLHQMRKEQIGQAGKIDDAKQPVDVHAERLFKVYQAVRDRFHEVDKNALNTMVYTPDFNDRLYYEYEVMRKFISDTHPEVRKIVSTFQTRLLKILIKMAVLCSVAEALSIKDKSKRFRVTSKNVEAAGVIVQQCYKTLVAWLEQSLKRTRRKKVTEKDSIFFKAAKEVKKDEEGFFAKNDLMKKLEEAGVTYSTRYRMFGDYENDKFIKRKTGRTVYLKLKEEKK